MRVSSIAQRRRIVCLATLFVVALGCGSDGSELLTVKAALHPQRPLFNIETAYDGETVFRGLVFGEGSVAALVPELMEGHSSDSWASNSTEQTAIDNMQAEVVNYINTAYPGFIGRFGDAMQSGNHSVVDVYLDSAATVVDEYAMTVFRESESEYAARHADGAGVPEVSSYAAPETFQVTYDTVIVDNGEANLALGVFRIADKVIYLNEVAAVNKVAMLNTATVVNKYTGANAMWFVNKYRYWGRPIIKSVASTWGSSELARETVVDLVVTRLGPSSGGGGDCPPPELVC